MIRIENINISLRIDQPDRTWALRMAFMESFIASSSRGVLVSRFPDFRMPMLETNNPMHAFFVSIRREWERNGFCDESEVAKHLTRVRAQASIF